jgi:tetratricopeptide (TPR) repeat protein
MRNKQYAQALADYQAAMKIPDNLQEAAGNVSRHRSEICFWIGGAYQAMGDSKSAERFWTDSSGAPALQPAAARRGGSGGTTGQFRGRGNVGGLGAGVHVEQATLYYQGLALQKLGQADRAVAIFQQLINAGEKVLGGALDVGGAASASVPFAQRAQIADAHYLVGIGELGLNHADKAREEFSLALQNSPDHYAATMALAELGPDDRP